MSAVVVSTMLTTPTGGIPMNRLFRYALVLFVLALPILSAEVSETQSKLKPLDDKTRCVAVFKEILVCLKYRDLKAVFGSIMDGSAHDRFKMMPQDTPIEELEDGEKGVEGFIEKNFRGCDVALSTFDEIRFSDLETQKGAARVRLARGREEAEGDVLTMNVLIPALHKRELNRTGSHGYTVFSRLEFVKLKGKIYWIPFGW